jgi:hypothetical protein
VIHESRLEGIEYMKPEIYKLKHKTSLEVSVRMRINKIGVWKNSSSC